MRENFWINTNTNVEVGINTSAGSPRAWLMRAVGQNCTANELDLVPGSLHPKLITVAGLWRRGKQLPDTGNNKTLFRFFDLPENLGARKVGRKTEDSETITYIGMCSAVPEHEILMWIRAFKKTGADWTWWAYPEEAHFKDPNKIDGRPKNKKLDHELLYERFEQGAQNISLALEFDVDATAIAYVRKKWMQGKPAKSTDNRLTDQELEEMFTEIRAGKKTLTEIADDFKVARATVSKWAGRIGESKRGKPYGKA